MFVFIPRKCSIDKVEFAIRNRSMREREEKRYVACLEEKKHHSFCYYLRRRLNSSRYAEERVTCKCIVTVCIEIYSINSRSDPKKLLTRGKAVCGIKEWSERNTKEDLPAGHLSNDNDWDNALHS